MIEKLKITINNFVLFSYGVKTKATRHNAVAKKDIKNLNPFVCSNRIPILLVFFAPSLITAPEIPPKEKIINEETNVLTVDSKPNSSTVSFLTINIKVI